METDRYEIDVNEITFDDLELLDELAIYEPGKVRPLREMFGRIVINKTEDEIRKLKLPQLAELLRATNEAIGEAFPKATESDSQTS